MDSVGSRSTASVLAELRWDDGYAVPVANAENKALEDELQKMQKEKVNLQNELTDFEERTEAMASHLKNVRQELGFTQVNRCQQQIHVIEQMRNLGILRWLVSLDILPALLRDLSGLYSRTSTGNKS
uniref:Coiled-coil domain-containing protein 39 n=1 Tax=Otus sunia TaxID=257818 RepID=A0A8C8AHP8_9STRI